MPTTTVGHCIDMAERKILDESNDEYSEQNLLDLYHLSIKEIINLAPRSHTESRIWKLAPMTRQVCPADAVEIVDEGKQIRFRFDDRSFQTMNVARKSNAYGFFVLPKSTKPVVFE